MPRINYIRELRRGVDTPMQCRQNAKPSVWNAIRASPASPCEDRTPKDFCRFFFIVEISQEGKNGIDNFSHRAREEASERTFFFVGLKQGYVA